MLKIWYAVNTQRRSSIRAMGQKWQLTQPSCSSLDVMNDWSCSFWYGRSPHLLGRAFWRLGLKHHGYGLRCFVVWPEQRKPLRDLVKTDLRTSKGLQYLYTFRLIPFWCLFSMRSPKQVSVCVLRIPYSGYRLLHLRPAMEQESRMASRASLYTVLPYTQRRFFLVHSSLRSLYT